jgi:hypothetical protein
MDHECGEYPKENAVVAPGGCALYRTEVKDESARGRNYHQDELRHALGYSRTEDKMQVFGTYFV